MAVQVSTPSSVGFTGKTKYRYDVFLSFRGEDTRKCFTVNLYDNLRKKGINAFIDDRKLGKGERIAPSLLKAIEKSRISIIVFSKNYATSTWCLDELAHIIQCKKEKNQVVMPLFYKVDPMDVQYQRNSFEEAMVALEERFRNDAEKERNSFGEERTDHEDRLRKNLEKLQKWRSALFEAASLSSAWLFQDGCEFRFIERIVEYVYAMLPPKPYHNIEHMVGLEPRIEEVISLLNKSDKGVCMLGIHGTGGIGKTTLAKAIYNSIFNDFEGACFLLDVNEASKKFQGIVHLQQKLLSEILEERISRFGSAGEGISKIKHRLSDKRVLLVLDDVDEIEQLEQLAGGSDWFGYGSKVIIATRNKQLLIAHNVEKTYKMKELNEHHSLELFCWHAFHMNQPPKDYQDPSRCAISYAQGLPLALRVIGSNLATKNLEEWRFILEKYERIPERSVIEVLKISYDCLQEGAQRIFLDIACLVDNVNLGSIREIVEASDIGARFYLEVLVDKSLITLADSEYLFIHDLIRQMGREIVRQEAPLNPEKRSRLWHYQDVLKMLHENLGSNNIKGIMLDPPQQEKVKWNGEAFEKMHDLRILIVRNVQFSTGPTYLPNSLRWLEWEEYPSTTLPTDFAPLELIFLKLPRSSFRLKEPFKIFANYLTNVDFSYCEFITEVPDVSQLQSLRRLRLLRCRNLIEIDDSVGYLSKMVQLNVSGCTKLSIFPREINMPSLERLDLTGCESLEYFPHVVGNMESLTEIIMENSAIKEVPPSIGNLSRLDFLAMNSCKSLVKLPTSLFTLPKLESLDLGECHPRTRKSLIKLKMQDIGPITTGYYVKYLFLANCGLLNEELVLVLNCFRSLQWLDLSKNDFVSLPKCIEECTNLRILDINNCKRLRDIPELPSKLHNINAENCISLTAESLDNLYSQAKKEWLDLQIRMPRSTTLPDWFNYCCEGGTLCFRARRNVPRLALALQFAKANMKGEHSLLVSMSINGREIKIYDGLGSYYAKQGHVLLVDLFMRREKELNECMTMDWNDLELQITCDSPDILIERCGVYVFKQQTNMENVQFKSLLVSRASPKRRAIASPPYEPPKKLLRKIKVAAKGKMNNTKKRTRTIKRYQAFQSCYKRKMVFPMGKLVWRFLYH